MIDLQDKRVELENLATKIFKEIVGLANYIRNDNKTRTGIKVLVWEANTRNLLLFSVGDPSEAAQVFVVEKAVRAAVDHDYSSGNTANSEKMQFAGCVGLEVNGQFLQVSVSGLQEKEDVTIAIILLANLINENPWKTYKIIQVTAVVPDFLKIENDYLGQIIKINS